MKKLRPVAMLLALVMVLSALLTGCGGGGGNASAENTYTWWIYSGADSMYYYDYQETGNVLRRRYRGGNRLPFPQ